MPMPRSWIFMCEQLYNEKMSRKIATSKRAVGDISGMSSGRGIRVPVRRGSRAARSIKNLIPGSKMKTLVQMVKEDAEEAKKIAADGILQSENEGEADDEGSADESVKLLNDPPKVVNRLATHLTLLKAKAMWKLKGLGKKKRDNPSESGESRRSEAMANMWSKKEAIAAHSAYTEGRTLVGEEFVRVFLSHAPSLVRDFQYGLSDQHGRKMGEALELIVTCATKPQVLQHKLRVLALGHVQMGVKPEQLAIFGNAIFDLLRQILEPYDMWDKATVDAWKWMWEIVHVVFKHHMETSNVMLQYLKESWDIIEEEELAVIIAEKFYSTLFRIAPQLQPMFTKPFKMQLVMLSQALDLIVRSVKDTKVLSIELKGLAMRHLRFDMHQDHLNVFGEVLLQTLQEVMGPERWSDEMEEAWRDIYMHISEVFGHVLSSGRNLVSKALADNDIDGLKRALAKSPRGKRISDALEIDVDDKVVSPIVWTIKDGQIALTEVLLQDLLALRGDRDHYYYGSSQLWQKHPWLVRLLVNEAPKLVPVLLDGHMWVSRFITDGHRRVNYYISDLYGNPELPENWDVYNTPLAVFAIRMSISELSTFAHPVVIFITELKWRLFGRSDFFQRQVVNAVNLALVTAYLQIGSRQPYVSFTLGLLQLIVGAVRVVSHALVVVRQLQKKNGMPINVFGRELLIPFCLTDLFVLLNTVSSTFCVILFGYTWMTDPFGWKLALLGREPEDWEGRSKDLSTWSTVAAFTSLNQWLQMTEVFNATTKLSALVYAFAAVMKEVMRFILVLSVWLLGFTATLYWLLVGANLEIGQEIEDAQIVYVSTKNDGSIFAVLYFLTMSCLGMAPIDVIMSSSWLIKAVFAVFVMSTVIVLLNLLVATMVNTYDDLQRSCNELAERSRALLVVRAEEQLSRMSRIRHYRGLQLDQSLPFEPQDMGPAGGIQQLEKIEDLNHPAFQVLDRIERYSGPTDQKLAFDPSTKQQNTFQAVSNNKQTIAADISAINERLNKLAVDMMSVKQAVGAVDDDGKSSIFGGDSVTGAREARRSSDAASLGAASSHGGQDDGNVDIQPRQFRAVEWHEVQAHASASSLWLVVDGIVHDCTSLVGFHPGGKTVLLEAAGRDASKDFHASHVGPSFTVSSAMLRTMPIVGRIMEDLPNSVPTYTEIPQLELTDTTSEVLTIEAPTHGFVTNRDVVFEVDRVPDMHVE